MKITLTATAGAAVLALSLAACGGASRSPGAAAAPNSSPARSSATVRSSTPAPSSGAPVKAGVPAVSNAQLAATLQSAALKTADLAPGFAMELDDDGATVKGQATLEICGFKFNSEKHRLVRRAYQAVDQKNGEFAGVDNELVAYDTPAAAAHALAEWEVAANTCPSGAVSSSDEPATSYTLIHAENNIATLPIKANTMTSESFSSADDSDTGYALAILQVKGRFLDAVVLVQDDPFEPVEQQIAQRLAKATGQRLAGPAAA